MSIRRMMLFTLGAKVKNLIAAFKERVLSYDGQFEAESCLLNDLDSINDAGVLDKSSVIITPNGYNEDFLYTVKPNTSTDGDMGLSRTSVPTRINQNGLVEYVPYNLIRYSQLFENAFWVKQRTTLAINSVVAPDGTLTGYKLIGDNGVPYVYTGSTGVNVVSSSYLISYSQNTISFYLKYGGLDKIRVMYGGATTMTGGIYVEVNLQSGTITASNGILSGNTLATDFFIEDAGDGWYRVGFTTILTISATNNRFGIGLGDSVKTTGNGVDGVYIWGSQLELGPFHTTYFPVTDRGNVPRVDYIYSGCPSILIEEQITNLWLNNNSATGYGSQPNAIKGNEVLDAFGYGFNGYEYQFVGGSTFVSSNYNIRTYNTLNNPIQRICLFIKNPSSDFFAINHSGGASQCNYQFSTLETRNYFTPGTSNGKILKISPDTYVMFLYSNTSTGLEFSQVRISFVSSLTSQTTVDGTAIIGLASHMQNALNKLPQVFLPIITGAASVTKLADAYNRTLSTDLIGQTEGSMYVEFKSNADNWNGGILTARDATSANRIQIRFNSVPTRPSSGYLNFCMRQNNGSLIPNINIGGIFAPNLGETYKVCVTYKQNEIKAYINGVLTDTYTDSYPQPGTMDTIQLGGTNTLYQDVSIRNAMLFKTVLTETEAINLTTL